MPEPRARAGADDAMQAAVDRVLPVLAWGLAAFYAALAVNWLATLRPAYPVLGGAWAASAVLLAAVALLSRRALPAPLRRALPTVAAAVALADGLLLVGVTREPSLTIGLYVTVLGFGLILASRPSLLLVIGAANAGLGLVALQAGGPGWTPRVFALVACSIAAFASQAVRIRLYTQLDAAHRSEVAAVREAEEAKRVRAEMETKSAFIRLAAHELATPLTTVTLQARALVRAQLPEPQARAAALLDRNVQRLNRLMRDVVTVTQYQAGVVPRVMHGLDLGSLVREQVAAAARRLGPQAQAEVREEAPVQVEADWGRLADALARLLENAARHGGAKPAVVTVGREGGEAVVRVRDFGPGVPPERVAAVFRPFSVDPNAVDGAGGAGLGLAVARLHVEAQGGRITYEAADPGAVFSIRLPLKP